MCQRINEGVFKQLRKISTGVQPRKKRKKERCGSLLEVALREGSKEKAQNGGSWKEGREDLWGGVGLADLDSCSGREQREMGKKHKEGHSRAPYGLVRTKNVERKRRLSLRS